jgi:hypothetical protein
LNLSGADPFAIHLNTSAPVQYCNDPVLLANMLTIDGNPSLSGMKISINQGFVADEDVLVYEGPLSAAGSTSGTLILTGGASVQDYVDALHLIKYKNIKAVPTLGTRKITISLNDVDYLPQTGHFYRFVSKPLMAWSAARDEADATMYYGLRGYLATITSQVENDFIRLKTTGVGWIGGSDAAVEGQWRWVTGPEGLNGGVLFWEGKGSGAPFNSAYSNWNSNEPNDSGGNEDFAHITFFPNNPFSSYKWNDLPNAGGGGDYVSAGYLIEFGGYADEHELNLSATLDLQVNTMLFKTGTIAEICEGETVLLNQPDATATYSWTPSQSLSNSTLSNPIAKPSVTTSYIVQGTRGICTGNASFTVPIRPMPVSLLKTEENICKGASITLDPGGASNDYVWSNGATSRTITVNTQGEYKVTLSSGNGCKNTSTTKVIINDYPTIDLSKLNQLSCGVGKTNTLDISTNATSYSLTSSDSHLTISGSSVSSSSFGVFPVVYTANHAYCPSHANIDLSFYKTPTVNFTIDDHTCSGYNLNVSYLGDATLDQSNFKWEFGGSVIANAIGLNTMVVPLGINRSQRDLSLTVTQDGCSNTFVQKDIKVIPNLDLQVKTPLGCEPFTAEFTANNTEVVVYDWNFGDGSPVQRLLSSPAHTYQNSGFYHVNLKVTTIVASGNGCTNEVKIDSMVHVAPIPDVDFSLAADQCLNPGLTKIAYAGAIGTASDKYIWDLSALDPSEIVYDPLQSIDSLSIDLKVHPTASLGLKVISKYGCESLSKSIVLKRNPDFSILSDFTAGCIPFLPNLSAQINDPNDRVDFTWDFGNGLTGTGSNVSSTYVLPDTKYSLSLIGKSSITGCSNTLSGIDFLKTYPKPHAAFTMDHPVVYSDKPDVTFTDASLGASSWMWDFADGSTSSTQNPIYHFVKMGHQRVILEAMNSDLCADTVSHTVLVAFDRIFPPNGFSPNAKNAIDRIFTLNSEGIIPAGYHLTIQSRWDDLVFETKDEIKGWDGRIKNGSFAPTGVYVWVLLFTDFLGHRHKQTGTVALIY